MEKTPRWGVNISRRAINAMEKFMKNKLFLMGILVMVLAFGMTVVGCASAPPTAFELAESLEGTAWQQGTTSSGGVETGGHIMIMNDKTSGVLTDRDDKETAFTYTAEYDADTRSFAGTITLEDGRASPFSAKIGGVGVFSHWALTAGAINGGEFYYRTPEHLEEIYRQKRIVAEIVEKYGSEYKDFIGNRTLTRNGDDMMVAYDFHGFRTKSDSFIEVVSTAYRLYSKDGITMTLLRFDVMRNQYESTNGVGTFNVSVSGDTVTISGGTGAGAEFNGTYR